MEKSGIEWSKEEVISGLKVFTNLPTDMPCDQNINELFRSVATATDDSELPVRIQAILALTEMVTAHESGTF